MSKTASDPVTQAERDQIVTFFSGNGVPQPFIDGMIAQYGPVETWARGNMAAVISDAIKLLGTQG